MEKKMYLAKKNKKSTPFHLFLSLSFLIQTQLDRSVCLGTTTIFQEARSAGYLGGGTRSLRAVRRYHSTPNQI